MKVFINDAARARWAPILGRFHAAECASAEGFGPPIAASEAALVRSRALLGRLSGVVLVAGLGGVGGACASALARCGVAVVGVDADVFEASNQNRQLHSEHTGAAKAQVYAVLYGILGIHARILATSSWGDSARAPSSDSAAISGISAEELVAAVQPDIVIDAIDSVGAKAALILAAQKAGCQVLSSGGAAKRIDASAVGAARWDAVAGCALSRAVRARLRRAGYAGDCRVVFSSEQPRECSSGAGGAGDNCGEVVLGSIMPVTATFGLRLASEALKLLQR